MIEAVDQIVREYEARGYVLTVRQVYYQLVSRNLIGNVKGAYDRIQSAVNDGRLVGLISWEGIEDRGRQLRGLRTHTSPEEAVRELAESYRCDLWANQPIRPEVYIEKQALEGVIEQICLDQRVDFYATKGYDSQSQSFRAGRRFAERMRRGQRTVVIHLGDHDPSGVDMTRDNHERLTMFAGFPIPVERVALNMDQIEEFDLPRNIDNRPKLGDARTAAYVEKYGDQGWELDALDPDVIANIIRRKVEQLRDPDLWSLALAEEVSDRRWLGEVARGGASDNEEE